MKCHVGFAGKVAIVTGGASGIGYDVAHELASRGARVVVCDIARAEEAAARLCSAGFEALGVAVDIADPVAVQAAVDQCLSHFGRLDALVNNAGIFTSLKPQVMDEIDLDEWRRVMDVNVMGPYLFCRAAWPAMRAAGGGHIVNVTSSTVFFGAPRLLHYVASKGALTAMTRSMAREMGADGITVNAVAPGFTLSEGVLTQKQSYLPSQSERSRAQRAIARDQVPQDLVGAIAFFCQRQGSVRHWPDPGGRWRRGHALTGLTLLGEFHVSRLSPGGSRDCRSQNV